MRNFSQIDVFTDEIGFGNPVAVVHDAAGLTTEQMQTFARWTNLSETTFLLRPDEESADYRVRIFTGSRELPFAGHPTLGSARAWLAAGGQPHQTGLLVQECGAGLIRISQDNGRLAFAAPPLIRSGPVDAEELAAIIAALGADPAVVVDAQWADNGPGWVAVLLRDVDTVLRVEPQHRALQGLPNVGVVARHESGDLEIEVRAFFGDDATEDPVTGSLNASVAQWLIGTGRTPTSYVAAQGQRLGRRGRIHVDQRGDDIWVGGDTVVGVRGQVAI